MKKFINLTGIAVNFGTDDDDGIGLGWPERERYDNGIDVAMTDAPDEPDWGLIAIEKRSEVQVAIADLSAMLMKKNLATADGSDVASLEDVLGLIEEASSCFVE